MSTPSCRWAASLRIYENFSFPQRVQWWSHRLLFGGKSRTWQTWIPTSLCRRNNPSDFWPLAMCEAHLSWMFAKPLWHGAEVWKVVFSDFQFLNSKSNRGIIHSKCLDRKSTCNDIDVHTVGWMRSCSVPSRLWCFWVLVDPASPSCCWTTQRWWGIGSHFWHFYLKSGRIDGKIGQVASIA